MDHSISPIRFSPTPVRRAAKPSQKAQVKSPAVAPKVENDSVSLSQIETQKPEPAPSSTPPTPKSEARETTLPSGVSQGANGTLFMEEPQQAQQATFPRELAQKAIKAELGEGFARDYEIFYHGSSSGQSQLDFETVPRNKLFASATLETAELFAHRKTGRVPGEPTMTAIAIEKSDFERIRKLKLATTKQIDDMPGKIETIFLPGTLERFAEHFIPIPKGK